MEKERISVWGGSGRDVGSGEGERERVGMRMAGGGTR